jgi:hypothetical protein
VAYGTDARGADCVGGLVPGVPRIGNVATLPCWSRNQRRRDLRASAKKGRRGWCVSGSGRAMHIPEIRFCSL